MTIEEILAKSPLEESVKAELKGAWDKALSDAKIAQESKIRAELGTMNEAEIQKMKEAFGMYIADAVKPHVEELHTAISEAETAKENAAKASAILEANNKKKLKALSKTLRQVVEANCRDQISELAEDVQATRRAVLKEMAEKKRQVEEDRMKYRAKAGYVIKSIIEAKIPAQLDALKEDIEASRRDNFGRELYEAFENVFRDQFFNTGVEFRKLHTENKELQAQLESTKKASDHAIMESKRNAAKAKAAYNRLKEGVARERKINSLLKPLAGSTRAQMKAILESTSDVSRMDAVYTKNLRMLVTEGKKKSPMKTSKVSGKKSDISLITGAEKPTVSESVDQDFDEFAKELDIIRGFAGVTARK